MSHVSPCETTITTTQGRGEDECRVSPPVTAAAAATTTTITTATTTTTTITTHVSFCFCRVSVLFAAFSTASLSNP